MSQTFPTNYHAELLHGLPHRASDFSFVPRGRKVGPIASIEVAPRSGQVWLAEVGMPIDTGEPIEVELYSTPDPDSLLVDAGGTFYWVPVPSPETFEDITPSGAVRQIRFLREQGLILLVTDQEIVALGARGAKWDTGRIAIDGIEINGVIDTHIRGVTDADIEPRPFSVDLRTGICVGGSSNVQ